jgi:hypothetical protein
MCRGPAVASEGLANTMDPDRMSNEILCRLCSSPAQRRFSVVMLRKHHVNLYRCTRCRCLQTDPPYWLDQAYADRRPVRDVWMVSRTEAMRTLVLWTLRIMGKSDASLFDWGGGNGLLVRMLRDAGVDACVSDKYVPNYYAVGFDVEGAQKTSVMTAFEVFEHADDPRQLMADMTVHEPEVILLSTVLYAGQGKDWYYLHKDSGKHVFFYTAEGLTLLAEQFGYRCLTEQNYTVMHKHPLSRFQKSAMRILFRSGRARRWLSVINALLARRPGTTRDYAKLHERGRF